MKPIYYDDQLAPLSTLDEETGDPPESRVRSASGVRQRINELREGESTRSKRRRIIQGVLDGNPPYSHKKQRELNRANEANINLRTGEGTVDAAKTPYYDLIFETPRFLNVETDYGNDPQRWYEWSETISDGLHDLFDEWDGYDANTQLKQWQMCVHGTGFALFEDTTNWRWKSRTVGDVLVPDDAEANIDELDEAAIPRSYLPGDLYRLIKNEKAATARGWNVEMARKAIIKAAPRAFNQTHGNNWESYQEAIRTGDIAWSNKSNRILVVDHLVKEYSGKITHTILLDDGTGDQSTINKPDDEFLFKKVERFECFSQVICPFFYDVTGKGLWHGVKGLGPKIRDFCELENRMTGRMIDQAMVGVIAVPKNAEVLQRLETVQTGAVTWYPPGTEFQTTKLADSLEGPMLVKRDLQGTLQSNTGQYRQRVANENQEPTLGQAQMNAQQQAVLGKGAVNRYYKSLDRLYREMVRRVLNPKLSKSDPGGKEAFEFRGWCMERGVPPEALMMDNICKVKAVRSVGYGSPVMRELVSNKLISLASTMDEQSRRNAFRTALAPFVGQDHVDMFYPPFNQADVPNDQLWGATIENGELSRSDPSVLITPKQDHIVHFDSHFQHADQGVQELQAGQAKPMDVLTLLHNSGPHMRGHLNAVSQDPTRQDQLKQREAAWLQLSKIADQLQQQIMESIKSQQANQQAQQPRLDPALVAGLAKVHGDLQIKQTKMMGDHQLKSANQEFKIRLKDLETAHKLRLLNGAQQQESTTPSKINEIINYKDAPPDIRRQLERQARLDPSTAQEESPLAPAPQPTAPAIPETAAA